MNSNFEYKYIPSTILKLYTKNCLSEILYFICNPMSDLSGRREGKV